MTAERSIVDEKCGREGLSALGVHGMAVMMVLMPVPVALLYGRGSEAHAGAQIFGFCAAGVLWIWSVVLMARSAVRREASLSAVFTGWCAMIEALVFLVWMF